MALLIKEQFWILKDESDGRKQSIDASVLKAAVPKRFKEWGIKESDF